VVQAVQHRPARGWRTSIPWVPGHTGIAGNERADQLAGKAASEKRNGRTSIAWPTAAYGIEAVWEGQPGIVQSFHKLTARTGRDVSGTFASTMGVDAIREAATPPTRAALDRRTGRQFIRMITNSTEHPCKNYGDEWDQDPESGSLGRWLTRSSDGQWVRGQHVEQTKTLALRFTDWLDEDEGSVNNDKDSLHLYTDGSFRTCAAFGWT
jgi:hypothetical protein